MKLLIKLLLFLLAAILAGLLATRPVIAEAPQSNSSITNPPYGPIQLLPSGTNDQPTPGSQSTNRLEVRKYAAKANAGLSNGHSTRAEKTISEDVLYRYLAERKSPLALYSSQILESPYWSTIIGICQIEQYGCTHGPNYNLWGIMCGSGRLCAYKSYEDSINAISSLLEKYVTKYGKTTIESLNGYYVQPASNNWLNTVLRTKQTLESLD